MCDRQTTKKYTIRKSPPYPANKCPTGEVKKGNDGRLYKNTINKNGVNRWFLVKTKTPVAVKRVRVYVDNPQNRRLKRVGKPYGYKAPAKSKSPVRAPSRAGSNSPVRAGSKSPVRAGSKSPVRAKSPKRKNVYPDNATNRRLKRVGKPLGYKHSFVLEDPNVNIDVKQIEGDKGQRFELTNSVYRTQIMISVYKKPINLIGGDGKRISLFTKNAYIICKEGVCDEFCSANTKFVPLKLFLHAFYADKTSGERSAPRGYGRKALCELINHIKRVNKVPANSIIALEADGDVQGSKTALVKFYQKMGFKIVGFEYNYDDIEEKCKGNLNKDIVGSTLMAARLSSLLEYCEKH